MDCTGRPAHAPTRLWSLDVLRGVCLLGLLLVWGILWCLRWESRPGLATLRLVAALRRVGDISYSLYAMHTPALMLASWALLHLGIVSYGVQLAATLSVSLAAVLLVHYVVERRFYRRRA